MNTILGWFEQIKDSEVKEKAIANFLKNVEIVDTNTSIARMQRERLGRFKVTSTLREAFHHAFNWSSTPEGSLYWTDIHKRAAYNNFSLQIS